VTYLEWDEFLLRGEERRQEYLFLEKKALRREGEGAFLACRRIIFFRVEETG